MKPKKEALKNSIDAYFASCYNQITDEFGNITTICVKPPLVGSLAYHLGIDRDTLLQWEKDKNLSALVKNAKERIRIFSEESLFTNKLTTAMIFNLKCNYGWKDVQDVNVTGNIHIKFADEVEEEKEDE